MLFGLVPAVCALGPPLLRTLNVPLRARGIRRCVLTRAQLEAVSQLIESGQGPLQQSGSDQNDEQIQQCRLQQNQFQVEVDEQTQQHGLHLANRSCSGGRREVCKRR